MGRIINSGTISMITDEIAGNIADGSISIIKNRPACGHDGSMLSFCRSGYGVVDKISPDISHYTAIINCSALDHQ